MYLLVINFRLLRASHYYLPRIFISTDKLLIIYTYQSRIKSKGLVQIELFVSWTDWTGDDLVFAIFPKLLVLCFVLI